MAKVLHSTRLDIRFQVRGRTISEPGASMSVTIPDDILDAARMSEEELRQELAILLYERERITLAQAARLSGCDRLWFQHLLAARGITLHYEVSDFEDDLRTLRDLGRL